MRQETDNNNCGGCGLVCSGTCTGSACLTTLASGQGQPYLFAIDSTSVYWTNGYPSPESNTLTSVPISGGAVVTVVAPYRPGALVGGAVGSTSVYFSDENNVMSVPLAGGAIVTLVSDHSRGLSCSREVLAADRSNVYVGESCQDDAGTDLLSVGSDAGAVTTIASEQWLSNVVVDSTNVYWCNLDRGSPDAGVFLLRSARGGGKISTLAAAPSCWDLRSNGSMLVLGGAPGGVGGGTISVVALDGGASSPVASGVRLPSFAFSRSRMAVDSTAVYWAQEASTLAAGAIMKVLLDGGAVSTVASGQNSPSGIVVDSTSVYWTTMGDGSEDAGTVMKLTPK